MLEKDVVTIDDLIDALNEVKKEFGNVSVRLGSVYTENGEDKEYQARISEVEYIEDLDLVSIY